MTSCLFDLAIDRTLPACDLVKLRVADLMHGGRVAIRATVMQQKTHRRVQFEITADTHESTAARIRRQLLSQADFLFPSRIKGSAQLSARQYARNVYGLVESIGLIQPLIGSTHYQA